MVRTLAIAVALAIGATARAEAPAPLEIGGKITTGPAWDSNVGRRSTGAGVASAGGLFLLGGIDLVWRPAPDHVTRLSADGGARAFVSHGDESQLAQVTSLAHHLRLGDAWSAGVEMRRRDQLLRSGERDSADTLGSLLLEWQVTERIAPRLRVGYRRFDWWPDDRWSASGPWAAAAVELRPWPRHLATVGYDLHLRDHPERREVLQQGHLQWTWRRKVLLSAGYLFGVADSDVEGYRSLRHRFQLLVGAPLPAGLVLACQGTLQLISFPDGFRLDPVTVADDEENLSSLSLRLVRPIGEQLSIEARYQLHLATFARADLAYERHLLGSALTWRF